MSMRNRWPLCNGIHNEVEAPRIIGRSRFYLQPDLSGRVACGSACIEAVTLARGTVCTPPSC